MKAKYLEIASQTKLGVLHKVIVTPDGELKCSCPGYVFRGKCSHVDIPNIREKILKEGVEIT